MKSIEHVIGMSVRFAGVSLALSTMPGHASAQTAKVAINAAEMHQTIDGFGGAQPGGDPNQVPVQDRATMFLDPQGAAFPYRSEIMDLLFSAQKGIGLTILRMKINAMLEPSLGVWNDQDPAQAWIMQEAVKRGPVKLIASVWSPPAWMKTSGHTVGGSLGLEHYQHFADLLGHYVTQYASTNGVNIYAVSMSNEPDTDKSLTEADPWDTCTWTSDQIASFLANHLSPTFASHHVTTKIIAPEASNWDHVEGPYLTETYGNPNALARLDIAAGHLYGGTASRPFQKALNFRKKAWQTEVSGRHHVWDIDGALDWAQDIHDGLARAQISAWLWFVLFDGAADNELGGGLIGLRPAPGGIKTSRAFWALGNFSKFVRPGFVRIGTKATKAPNLYFSAYRQPTTGQLVVVVINKNTNARRVNFGAQGFTSAIVTPYITSSTLDLQRQPAEALPGTVTVPARSIVTYVGSMLASGRSVSNDFNGDGWGDILWHNASTGETQIWFMSGSSRIGRATVDADPDGGGALVGLPWSIVGTNNFNQDKATDILWHNESTGETQMWFMSGPSRIGRATVDADRDGGGALVGPPWSIVGTNDFNQDKATDILWHNASTGETQIWFMSGSSRIGRATVDADRDGGGALVGLPWSIVGTNDFSQDKATDILWHNASTGETQIWFMNGSSRIGRATIDADRDGGGALVGPPWSIVGTNDFNQDKATDILWHNASTGETQIWFMSGSSRIGRATVDADRDGGGALVGLPWSIMNH